jgi:hypothetical protein
MNFRFICEDRKSFHAGEKLYRKQLTSDRRTDIHLFSPDEIPLVAVITVKFVGIEHSCFYFQNSRNSFIRSID